MTGKTELRLHKLKVFSMKPYYFIRIKYHLWRLYLMVKLSPNKISNLFDLLVIKQAEGKHNGENNIFIPTEL